MTVIREDDFIQSVADALQYISYYHPVDYIQHLGRAYEREQIAGGEGRDRADPDQLAHVRRGPPADLPGHGHRHRVPQGRHGRALGREAQPRRDGQRGRAPRLPPPGQPAARLGGGRPGFARKNTRDNTPAVFHVELVPGDKVEVTVAAKGGGSENKSKFVMLNPSDSIVDWVLKTVPTMGAGWCPPGMLGIGIGGTAEKAMLLAKEALMEPIDMHELIARGPREQARGTAHRAVREGQRARHRRAGPRRPHHRARREDPQLPDARGLEAGGDDPELRRHAARALRARRLGPRGARAAVARALAEGDLERRRRLAPRQPRHADARRSAELEAGRDAAAERQDAHRPRRRAQAHRRPVCERAGPARGRRLHQPRHLLRRPGRSGARRGRGPGGSDDGDAHGQVHRDDAREDRPDRDDRQGRARPGGDRGDPQAQGGVPDGRRRRRLPGLQGDPLVARRRLRRPRHGGDLRVRREGHAGHRRGGLGRHLGAQTAPAQWAEKIRTLGIPVRVA